MTAPRAADDYELITADSTLPALLHEVGAVPVGYRTLREVMRANLPSA